MRYAGLGCSVKRLNRVNVAFSSCPFVSARELLHMPWTIRRAMLYLLCIYARRTCNRSIKCAWPMLTVRTNRAEPKATVKIIHKQQRFAAGFQTLQSKCALFALPDFVPWHFWLLQCLLSLSDSLPAKFCVCMSSFLRTFKLSSFWLWPHN